MAKTTSTLEHQNTLKEAKKVLGTTATGLTDKAIMNLVTQVDILTDVIIAHAKDSKIQSAIDIYSTSSHTGM